MKKILISLGVIGVVAAIVVGATTAYFSDTETSEANTFAAGTIDISVDEQNPWEGSFTMEDMKPCYTDYINFRIDNSGSNPNPVNIFKKLTAVREETGTVSEPECTEQDGEWTDNQCTGADDNNDLSSMIWYDLYVEVYDDQGQKIWWQTIYTDDDQKSIDDVYGGENDVFLGMIPAGGHMLVEQSYHLSPDTGNWAQGDILTFDIQVKGIQLHGTAWLENKEGFEPWKIILGDEIEGELSYKVKNPTFDFTFEGTAPLADTEYYLIAGGTPSGGSWDPDTELGLRQAEETAT